MKIMYFLMNYSQKLSIKCCVNAKISFLNKLHMYRVCTMSTVS